jgi:hypothetical protein
MMKRGNNRLVLGRLASLFPRNVTLEHNGGVRRVTQQ